MVGIYPNYSVVIIATNNIIVEPFIGRAGKLEEVAIDTNEVIIYYIIQLNLKHQFKQDCNAVVEYSETDNSGINIGQHYLTDIDHV